MFCVCAAQHGALCATPTHMMRECHTGRGEAGTRGFEDTQNQCSHTRPSHLPIVLEICAFDVPCMRESRQGRTAG
jgi:hypothetical protein